MAAEDLDWMGWTVIITVIIALLIMATDLVGPDLVFSVLLAFYVAAGILTVSKASANYGNSGLLTVIMLYIVAEGIYQTGGLESVMVFILGRSRSPFWANVRMMLPTMVLSAFLNNTPVVSLLTPILISWARRTGVPAKKVLIPLSYASVLGGTCTLIGTSTNLVISGAQTSRYERLKRLDDAKFRIFDIAPYGVPYALWGFLFVIIVQRWLLPGNSSRFATNILMALRVGPSSPVRGRAILDTGLHRLYGATLTALSRSGVFASNPSPKVILEEGDILYFAGEVDTILFYGEDAGLTLVSNENEDRGFGTEVQDTVLSTTFNKLTQVHVSHTSPLVGQRVGSATDLKTVHDLRVLGYQRSHGHPDTKLNEFLIKAGDILVVDAGSGTDFSAKEFNAAFDKAHLLKDSLAKEFVVAYRVIDRNVAGKTVSGAGLRGIPGLAVAAVDSGSKRHEPVDHDLMLQVGDTLWVLADLQGVVFLNKFPGLALAEDAHIERTGVNILYRKISQVVVSKHSSLVGKTVVSSRFRRKYKAAVIGWHREEKRTPLAPKDLVIQAGDVLLVMGSETFPKDNHHDRNFVMIDEVPNSNPPKKSKAPIAIFLGLAMITTQIAPGVKNDEWINLWPCAMLTWGLMLLTGCLSGDDARKSILWDVYLCIAAAFGVSNAMEGTGVANEFAQVFISIARNIGTEGAGLTAIYIATALLSEILTNNAAGAIMYPIAAVAGDTLGVDPRKMSVAIMLGASAGFINPFSYQCNLMVYTAGNYRTLEFAKIGAPFQVYLLIVSAFILHLMDHWHLVWVVSWVVVAAVIAIPALWAAVPERHKLPVEDKVGRAFSSFKKAVTFGRAKGSSNSLPTIHAESFGEVNNQVSVSRSSSHEGEQKPVKI